MEIEVYYFPSNKNSEPGEVEAAGGLQLPWRTRV